MAFSLAYTHTMDNTSDATQQAECRNALDYFFGTFLPARGWTNTFVSTNRYRHQWPVTNVMNSNATENMYGWSTYTGTQLFQYEDATYTTVPGDLGTDITNVVVMTFWSSGSTYKDKDWKFWTSTEDTSLYLVTQGTKTWFWGCKPQAAVHRENATYTTAANVDTYDTHYYFPMATQWYEGNAPSDTNTSSTETTLQLSVEESQYVKPDGLAFAKNLTFVNAANNCFRAFIGYNDIRRKVNDLAYRPISATSTSTFTTDTLEKYLVNSTDWWVSYGGITTTGHYMAFNFGTTEPDFS